MTNSINHKAKILLGGVILLWFLPFLALAADLPPVGDLSQIESSSGLRIGSVPDFAATIIRWVLGIVGVMLVLLIVYGGLTLATSAGNEERSERGRGIITNAVIGVVIVVIAWIASDYILSALFS